MRTVRHGLDVAAHCGSDLAALGCSRVALVTSAPLRDLCKAPLKALHEADCEALVIDSGDGEPTTDDLAAALQAAREFQADAVIGLGGGSAMDVAKLVAALYSGDQALGEVVGIDLLQGRKLPLACIPTTAGTGSEVTPIAIVEDIEARLKKGVVSPHLVPDFAYLDPRLTRSMPRGVTAATGLDALTHCIEAFTNRFSHPVVDNWALEGIRLTGEYLERACADGDDMEARSAMLRAAHLGGMCLGPVNTAAVHALAYPLGGEFHIAHGIANSLLLPHVLRFNLETSPGRLALVAEALGIARSGDDTADALEGIERIEALSANIGIERHLSSFGISENTIPHLAAAAMTVQRLLSRNPREVTEADAQAIYAAAL
ncbi:iron-containing alcohol dehydrogenase [Aurantiacibacter poecillastricola]|uniref:iron-containing alcohol dehydrogenase n=1 Tax=Aurantiacibacter poecillastricola TaxID=3064385 RepID=UPI00273E1B72|nr:iron-containing alcohol dehydrogenase [Aurantiacibacter sp. 219JJ12-13]MDP5263256.1 iron-containing alcohol dehydrogenase [Aurantiacibacter sp. 219JJ12-13]